MIRMAMSQKSAQGDPLRSTLKFSRFATIANRCIYLLQIKSNYNVYLGTPKPRKMKDLGPKNMGYYP